MREFREVAPFAFFERQAIGYVDERADGPARDVVLVEQRRRILQQLDDAAVIVHHADDLIANFHAVAGRHLHRQLGVGNGATLDIEAMKVVGPFARIGRLRSVLRCLDSQHTGERSIDANRLALAIPSDPQPDRNHIEQRLELRVLLP